MKIIHQAQYILLGLAAFIFSSCSQEEIELTKEVKQSELRVMVNYPDAAVTRATISGLSTSFEIGDQIGFFAVEKTEGLDDFGDPAVFFKEPYYNIPLTFDGSEWKPTDENVKLFHSPNYAYYAYYPYQENLNGYTNVYKYNTDEDYFEYNTAEGYFESIIDNWEPKLDQSKLEDYLVSDLMVGKGVSTTSEEDGSGTVSFNLKHQMGLVMLAYYDWESDEVVSDISSMNSWGYFFNEDADEGDCPIPYNPGGQYFYYITKPGSTFSFYCWNSAFVQYEGFNVDVDGSEGFITEYTIHPSY